MFEWLICAAGVAAQVPVDPAALAAEEAEADFLEFLADWSESESAAIDSGETPPGDGEAQTEDSARSSPGVPPEDRTEVKR